MLINISGIDARNVTQLSAVQFSQPNNDGLQNFPALIMDRYSGINSLMLWARTGEENGGVEEGCHAMYIGAFCSISKDVSFLIDLNHDYESISMSGQIPDLIPVSFIKQRKGSIIIQNDVWIGYGVTILSGVTIHNGAVIAANSTVTKDVPPYAIVAGSPARIIKYRFEPEIIEGLQRIQWWYWDEATIKERGSWFQRSPAEFVERFDVPKERWQMSPQQRLHDTQISDIPRENLYLVFSDMDNPYSVLRKIIKSFSETHTGDDCLVISIEYNIKAIEQMQAIYEFAEGIDTECSLYVRSTDGRDIPALIATCGTLVTSRVLELVRYTCAADLAGTRVVSGVDYPIFQGHDAEMITGQ